MTNPREYFDLRGNRGSGLFILVMASFSLLTLVASLSLGSARAALVVVAMWTVAIWICILALHKSFDRIVLAWLVVSPFCYYPFSFPREQALFTVDRAFILLVLLVLISALRQYHASPLQADVRIAGYFWATYLAVCMISLLGHPVKDSLGSYRLLFDGMFMPSLLGLYALRLFPAAENLAKLHACVCALMMGIGLVATLELLSGTNLLPFPGAVETWVRTSNVELIRVDGPFENSSVLCVIGILGFLFIVYSRRLLGNSLTRGGHILHIAGMVSSLAAALMPMNRGLVIALLVCACVDYFAREPLVPRAAWTFIFGALILLAIAGKIIYPGLYEDRVTSGANFYQRIAQNLQTLEVIRDHPLTGVGFGLYNHAVLEDSKYAVRWGGFEAINAPHNSISAVFAEEGGIGLFLYIAAQVFFIRAMYRHRHVYKLGWQTFLYCLLVYAVFGLDVGIAYYSDLNLFYMFVLGIILQIQLSMSRSEIADGTYGR